MPYKLGFDLSILKSLSEATWSYPRYQTQELALSMDGTDIKTSKQRHSRLCSFPPAAAFLTSHPQSDFKVYCGSCLVWTWVWSSSHTGLINPSSKMFSSWFGKWQGREGFPGHFDALKPRDEVKTRLGSERAGPSSLPEGFQQE